MQLPMTLALRFSRRHALLLIAAHGGALAIILAISAASALAPLPVLVLSTAILSSLLWQFLRLFGARRVVALRLHADGTLECVRRSNTSEFTALKIHPHTTVSPLLTLLLLDGGQGLWWQRLEPLVLLPDALDVEDFRRLRLWLRWRAAAPVRGSAKVLP